MDDAQNEVGPGPTREPDHNSVDKAVFLSQIDQHVAEIAEKLKGSVGYQITFSTRIPDQPVMNHYITNNFQKDQALKVHEECSGLIVESLKK